MTYQVVITQRAKNDLSHYYSLAAQHARETALRWLNRFEIFLGSLTNDPERAPIAPKDTLVEETIRQLFFGKRVGHFRVLSTIRDQEVVVAPQAV